MRKQLGFSVPRFARSPGGAIGLAILIVVVLVAFGGPLIAPHSPDQPIGPPGALPGHGASLGTDALGRDVFSRVLYGGRSVVLLGTASTLIAYAIGLAIGLIAGFSRSLVDPILMRSVDILLAFPALLVLLLLVSGLGTSVAVLVLGVVLVEIPAIARTVRTSALEVTTRGFVEASIARGESTLAILRHDVVPNIAPVLLAQFGILFSYSVILIASMNYLGLGLTPPTADWGLMISENRQLVGINSWSVLAPAVLLALLTIGVNLIADAYTRTSGSSAWLTRRQPRSAEPLGPRAVTPEDIG